MLFSLLLTLLPTVCLAQTNCTRSEQVAVTFYGYPDNTPAGSGIKCDLEYKADCDSCNNGNSSNILRATTCGPRGETAGGTGTYDDPLTMASAPKWFCHLEVVYLPYIKKYLRYEDYCQACIDDAKNGKDIHIDLWTGSTKTNGGKTQIKCENALTPGSMQEMIRNPPPNLPVDSRSCRILSSHTALIRVQRSICSLQPRVPQPAMELHSVVLQQLCH